MTPADVDALGEIVRAVRALPRDPEMEARQAAGQQRIRERNARLTNPDREANQ